MTERDELVERVARAIYNAEKPRHHADWEVFTTVDGNRDHALSVARAAIAECEKDRYADRDEPMRVLHGLTPGGSEFVNDPVACGQYLRGIKTALHEARREITRCRNAYFKTAHEVTQSLGKALDYPWYKDDQNNFPGAREEDGVCVGDHVPESIADEAADKIRILERESLDNVNRAIALQQRCEALEAQCAAMRELNYRRY